MLKKIVSGIVFSFLLVQSITVIADNSIETPKAELTEKVKSVAFKPVLYNFNTGKKEKLDINPQDMTDEIALTYLPDIAEVKEIYNAHRIKENNPMISLMLTYKDYIQALKQLEQQD